MYCAAHPERHQRTSFWSTAMPNAASLLTYSARDLELLFVTNSSRLLRDRRYCRVCAAWGRGGVHEGGPGAGRSAGLPGTYLYCSWHHFGAGPQDAVAIKYKCLESVNKRGSSCGLQCLVCCGCWCRSCGVAACGPAAYGNARALMQPTPLYCSVPEHTRLQAGRPDHNTHSRSQQIKQA